MNKQKVEKQQRKKEPKFTMIPGIIYITAIATVAYIIGALYPIIGGAISGIIIGISINHFFNTSEKFSPGIDFTLKTLLKVAIILLGFSFSLTDILSVGVNSLIIVLVTVVSGLLLTYYIGRMFGLRGNTSFLIGSGTAICGATAIVTLSPIIKAKEEELTYAVNTIFAFNVLAILTFPVIGALLNMSDYHFGIWAGAAIHDTSSVVAAGYAYSDEAGAVSVVVKLARTLMLIPLALAVAIFQSVGLRRKVKNTPSQKQTNSSESKQNEKSPKKESAAQAKNTPNDSAAAKVNILQVFPYFILVFVGVALVNTFITLPTFIPETASIIAKFLIVMVMVSVGLKTDIRKIRQVGFKPLIVGLIASVLISCISLSLISWLT